MQTENNTERSRETYGCFIPALYGEYQEPTECWRPEWYLTLEGHEFIEEDVKKDKN